MGLLDDVLAGQLNPSRIAHALGEILRAFYYQEQPTHSSLDAAGVARLQGGSAPDLIDFGPLLGLRFTPGVSEAYRALKLPLNAVEGTLACHIHWTKALDGDASGTSVRWEIEYVTHNGRNQNAAAATTTVTIDDTYEDDSTDSTRIVHRTADIPIPAVPRGYYIAALVRVSVVGTNLASDPVLTQFDFTWDARSNEDPSD